MKKTLKNKKLALNVEHVRVLKDADLQGVNGGVTTAKTCGCTLLHCHTR
jgi:hypothetical protein